MTASKIPKPREPTTPSFLWHTPTTEFSTVRQVSWLAGQSLIARLPGLCASDILGERLTAHSCGTAPVSHRIPS